MAIKVTLHEDGDDPIYCICDLIEVNDELTGKTVTIADKTTERFFSRTQLESKRDEVLEILAAINQ